MHAVLATQIDPHGHQKEQPRSLQETKSNTLRLIVECWWYVKKTSVTENYDGDIRRSLERDVFLVIGEICITNIRAHMLVKAIQLVQA